MSSIDFKDYYHMTQALIRSYAREIWSHLGPGFSERVYHNAMEVCLRHGNIAYETERVIPILFKNHALGNIRADLIIDQKCIIELKSVKALKDEHRTQTTTYMRLLNLSEGYLINFPNYSTPEPEIEFFTK